MAKKGWRKISGKWVPPKKPPQEMPIAEPEEIVEEVKEEVIPQEKEPEQPPKEHISYINVWPLYPPRVPGK